MVKRKYQCNRLEEAYRMGFDGGKNGANTTNCHFSLFDTSDRVKAWKHGKSNGER